MSDIEDNLTWAKETARKKQREAWDLAQLRLPSHFSVSVEGGTSRPIVGKLRITLNTTVEFDVIDDFNPKHLELQVEEARHQLVYAIRELMAMEWEP